VIQTMRGFSFSLGVRCQHCHAPAKEQKGSGGEPQLDFASDELRNKRVAREMIKMVGSINEGVLAKLEGAPAARVDCATCHRGLPQPRAIDALVGEKIEKEGTPAAVALYRELRKKYYGGAQYDFGETPLNRLGEALLGKKQPAEAAAIMELNAELNQPLSGWGVNVMAMAHQRAGAREKAIADYRRALELNPGNKFAREQLQALQSGSP
jgi:tetratricopeptide (TPR) repeat protein